MLASGIHFIMLQKLVDKLERVDATSKEKAVTSEEAKFTLKEKQWLNYYAGGFMAKIKKTADQRYYV